MTVSLEAVGSPAPAGTADKTLRLRLPATSANLGPGFDTLALALALYLEIEAVAADAYSIAATGRNQEICSRLEGNLLLAVYRDTVRKYTSREAAPLALTTHNGIPLGMGCGSSAASRLAGVALAAYFGELGWSADELDERILAEACLLEGHPDNAAACWLGGFVASGWAGPPRLHAQEKAPGELAQTTSDSQADAGPQAVAAVSIIPPPSWRALLVLPEVPLATTASRAVLPNQYSRADAVLNLQRVAVLTAAFAAGRGDLLASATGDSLHQPYRSTVCALLAPLLPLAGRAGILSVTLSGAGPAVLLLLENERAVKEATRLVHEQCNGVRAAEADRSAGPEIAEILTCALPGGAAEVVWHG